LSEVFAQLRDDGDDQWYDGTLLHRLNQLKKGVATQEHNA
jgi:hypothetical protein